MSKSEEIILEIKVNNKEGLIEIGKHQVAIDELKAKQAQYREELERGEINKKEYRAAVNETTQAIKFEQDAIRILSKEIQNNIKQEKAAADSIDGMKAKLSNLTAQYNALSSEQRKGAAGDKIKNDIVVIDQALKAEEQSLGNFRRQVGNYEVATSSLRQELRKLREEMANLKLAGKDNTAEYQQMAEKAGQMSDAMGDVNREVGVGASDTKGLDRIKGATDLLAGSFTMLNSVQGVFASDQERMSAIVQKVQIGIGALSAATAIQNAIQKESIVMNTIELIQKKARVAALAMEAKGTVVATVAQRIFNAVANANPYVLLATLLLTVVGALVAFASGSENSADKQTRLNATMEEGNRLLELKAKKLKDVADAQVKTSEHELALAKAQGKSTAEIETLEKNVYNAKMQRNKQLAQTYWADIALLDSNKKKAAELELQLSKLQLAKDMGSDSLKIDVGGKVRTLDKDEIEEWLTATQGQFDALNQRITIATEITTESSDLQAAEKERVAAKAKADGEKAVADAKDRRQKELDAIRAAQDAVFDLAQEGREKEEQALKIQYTRQIEDLKIKLRNETNLSAKAKAAIDTQIKKLAEKQTQELAKIDQTYSRATFDKQLEEQELFIANRLARAKEGTQTEFNLQMQSLETQMAAEIEANNRKVETEQIDEILIREKYAAMREQATAEYNKRVADNEVNKMRLDAENKLLQMQLDSGNELQTKLTAKQAEIDAITQLEEESDEAFLNRKLNLANQEKAIIEDIAAKKQQEAENMLTSVGSAFGAISELLENMAEDNEALATFSKVMALFQIGINTAVAITNAVKNADLPFPANLAAIATGVAAVIAAVAQSTAIINKSKQPKAPKLNKYATGGVIEGPGSGTSDSVPAMLSSGESVLTALTTSMFAPILSSFNQIGGGVPIQVVNTSAQVMGEDMLARAFAKGAAMLPAPIVDVREVTNSQERLAKIEELRGV